MAEARIGFELAVPPQAAARAIRACGLGGARAVAASCIWHDTPARALELRGLALAEWRGRGIAGWRLEPRWEPGPPVSEAPGAAALDLPGDVARDDLAGIGGFTGRVRTATAGTMEVTVLSGALRAGDLSAPCCRVRLAGPAAAVATLANELAAIGAIAAPPLAAGLGGAAPPRAPVPLLDPHASASAALARICGHLAALIAAQAGPAAEAAGPEPVHQMRVAVRRLRSAIKLFKSVAACPELATIGAELRRLGQVLGPARDWDVFIAGAGKAVAAAFPEDAAVAQLLAAAARQRQSAYASLRGELAAASFRRLGIGLALAAAIRPWEGAEPSPHLRDFAAAALARRRRRLRRPGRNIAGLEPPVLHAIRIQAKRLRYAAELFAPLWDDAAARRCIRRMTAVQEQLGQLNDASVAAELMARLGPAGRGRAGGIVLGFVAARSDGARRKVGRAWRKAYKAEPFWS